MQGAALQADVILPKNKRTNKLRASENYNSTLTGIA